MTILTDRQNEFARGAVKLHIHPSSKTRMTLNAKEYAEEYLYIRAGRNQHLGPVKKLALVLIADPMAVAISDVNDAYLDRLPAHIYSLNALAEAGVRYDLANTFSQHQNMMGWGKALKQSFFINDGLSIAARAQPLGVHTEGRNIYGSRIRPNPVKATDFIPSKKLAGYIYSLEKQQSDSVPKKNEEFIEDPASVDAKVNHIKEAVLGYFHALAMAYAVKNSTTEVLIAHTKFETQIARAILFRMSILTPYLEVDFLKMLLLELQNFCRGREVGFNNWNLTFTKDGKLVLVVKQKDVGEVRSSRKKASRFRPMLSNARPE